MKENFFKKNRFKFIVFFIDAIGMILELVASRILSPYFGNSNVVWTSIIGIILLSGSIGNFLGGKIADEGNTEKKLKIIFLILVCFIFVIPIINEKILGIIILYISHIKLGAILGTIILFLFPSMLIGFINPIILKIELKNIESVGKTSGKLYAISTLGGIFGTFLGGFFLIPNIGSVYILFFLTIIVLLLIPIIDMNFKNIFNYFIVILTVILIIIMNVYIIKNNSNGKKVLNGNKNTYVSYDTQYGRVIIYNSTYNNENIRILNIDSGYESATYTDEDKIYDLVFKYTQNYNLMFEANKEIKNTMLIGGAGYSYPKYYISNYKDKNIDVVEIDGDITQIAKKYFYLDKLIKEYNLEENKRLNLINEDGRVYINNTQKKYDAILNDAFSGTSPAKLLTTLEAVSNIKKCLNENGVYLTNIISSLEGDNSKFIRAEVNTIKQIFKNVYVIPCDSVDDVQRIQNNMVIATDYFIDFEGVYELNLKDNEIIITDAYCPVDTLIPQI